MSHRELHSFRWNGKKWAVIGTSSHSDFESNFLTTNQQSTTSAVNGIIRLATFNVLADCFPWFIEIGIRSPERFEWLPNGITNLNPTIIGLNEVTAASLQQLRQCSFIRENYFITESFSENENDNTATNKSCVNGLISHPGCIILSKLPLLEVFAISVSGSNRDAVVGKVQLGSNLESCVYVCAHHTTAYQTPKNAQLRAQQIREIVGVVEPLGLPFVLMGDLNLHYEFEDAAVIEHRFIDAWAQTHFSNIHPFDDGDVGYTFDSVNNEIMPYYIPGEWRRMRLDRILFSSGFPAYAVKPCAMWANERIKADNYLFPSDHFGLFIDIVTEIIDGDKNAMPMGEADSSAEKVLRHNAQNNTNRQAHRLGFVRASKAWISHALWLGGVALGLK